jgi:hypothetical protein
LRIYPLEQAQVAADPALTNGKPKSIESDCPVCFKSCNDNIDPVVCCISCGHYAHKPCFDVRAKTQEG